MIVSTNGVGDEEIVGVGLIRSCPLLEITVVLEEFLASVAKSIVAIADFGLLGLIVV